MTPHRILVILPHPDDEAFGLSGTLAMYLEEQAQITYACLTLGEMGRNMGVPPFANRVTLPMIRKRELEASCRAIGIQDLRMLGFHDKMIEFEDQEELDRQISLLIQEISPTIVFTFYPGFSVHPDHDACGTAVVRTIARIPKENRPVVYCMAFAKNHEQALGNPHIVHDVSRFLPQKLQSIRAHRTQIQAAELLNPNSMSEEEWLQRYGTEVFWKYPFKD